MSELQCVEVMNTAVEVMNNIGVNITKWSVGISACADR